MKKIIMLIFLSLASLHANAGLIFEDDFGTGGNNGTVTGSFGNWTVVKGNIDLWGNFSGFDGLAIDLGGTNANGTIRTTNTFSFLAGQSYSLSFLLGNNTNPSGDNNLFYGIAEFETKAANLASPNYVGRQKTIDDLSGLSETLTQLVTLDFTAINNFDAFIFFDGRGTVDSAGAIVDNVRLLSVDNNELAAEVPEPSTLALFALALIGLASRRYTKR